MASTSSSSRNEVELAGDGGEEGGVALMELAGDGGEEGGVALMELAGDGGEEGGVALMDQQGSNKIQRVPSFLRGSNSKDDYDPKVISIGPYHHGKPELQLLEGFKHKVFDTFIGRRDATFYWKKVLKRVDELRRCYDEGSTDEFDNFHFAEMMLLDSCFLIFYILSVAERNADYFWRDIKSQLLQLIGFSGWFCIPIDIWLVENQIPLCFVEWLFGARDWWISWKQLLVQFCQASVKSKVVEEEEELVVVNTRNVVFPQQPLHLLEAVHMHMVRKSDISSSRGHSIDVGCFGILTIMSKDFEKYGYIFRSVMDLKSKGIHFGHSDNIHSVLSIEFESNCVCAAKLKLPIWYATPISRVFFTNIIAYEMCPNNRTHLEITSYINFMKSLIVCPSDVKELREKRIISNILGDDMEVVQLFKSLNPQGFDNPNIFSDVKKKIQGHYDCKAKTWMAELGYTHCRSPWTIISLFAALVLLVLTFLQTYAAFKQRK